MRYALIAALLFALSACGTAATPTTHTITGKVEVITSSGCGQDGYSDINSGGNVTIKNESGTVIGTGALSQQVATGQYSDVDCIYTFTATNVPEAKFYGVEVGHRNSVQFSAADMRAKNWTISMSVG